MLTHVDPRLRGAAAILAVGVYLAPPALGVVAELSHIAYHVHEAIEAQRMKAAAFGLAHMSESSPGPRFEADGHHGFAHTHGGFTHHHSGAVDTLLSAVGHADTEIGGRSARSMEISTHLPADGAPELGIGVADQVAARASASVEPRPGRRPPIPPPRIRALP